jgi:hypothetical protein
MFKQNLIQINERKQVASPDFLEGSEELSAISPSKSRVPEEGDRPNAESLDTSIGTELRNFVLQNDTASKGSHQTRNRNILIND